MNLKLLKLQHFLSHTSSVIKFKDGGIYTIVGKDINTGKSIGSGKSSIPDGLAFALHGVLRKGMKYLSELIKTGFKEAKVGAIFELNDNNYTIIRTINKKSSKLTVSKNGTKLDLLSSDAQLYINKLLGADSHIFKNTSYFKQGDLDSFSKLTPKEAKELLMQILQLDIYDKYKEAAKKELDDGYTRFENMEEKISTKTELLENLSTKSEPNNLKITKLESSVQNIKKDLEVKKVEIQKAEERHNKLRDKINEKQKRISTLEGQTNILKNRKTKLIKLEDRCPLCEQQISKKDILAITQGLDQQIIEFRKDIAGLDNNRLGYIKQSDNILMTPLKKELNRLSDSLLETNSELSATRAYQEEYEKKQKQQQQLKKEIVMHKKELKKLEKKIQNYDSLVEVFGRNGIQACIIENLIPEIETIANTILRGLDEYLHISITTTKILKSGRESDTLRMLIKDKTGERSYFNYSGGEKTLINFALRIALSIVLARRANTQIQTLILDECFTELDSIDREKMVYMIKKVSQNYGFKKVLVISHCEEINDIDEHLIQVVKDENGSRIV